MILHTPHPNNVSLLVSLDATGLSSSSVVLERADLNVQNKTMRSMKVPILWSL